jgi:hypothetical protein
MNIRMTPLAAGLLLACSGGASLAAAPDWSKVPSKSITVFYPGVSPIEWITKGTEHGGAKGLKKGENCTGCHEAEVADMGKKMASGQKIEPAPIAGKAPSIPVSVQAARDDANLYLRFTWKQPPASTGGAKMDATNPVKVAFMLEDNKVELAGQAGCWSTCHTDARTMPGAADTKTKYVTGGSVSGGKYYDLVQWRSKEKAVDGYVADKRVMEGGKALVEAKGELKGDTWTVTFTRKLAGGEGDITLEPGKTYNFGFAIHDDHAAGRFHHVSLGYSLGIDAKADLTAAK